jgi:hypothetical protein
MLVGLMLGLVLGLLLAHLHRPRRFPPPPLDQQCRRLFLKNFRKRSRTRESILEEIRAAGPSAVRLFKQRFRDKPQLSEEDLEEFFSNVLNATAQHTCERLTLELLFTEPSRN